jgi:hypothetical protein
MSVRSFRRAQARRQERESRRARMLARRGRLLAGTTLTATALMTANAQAATNTYVVTTNTDDAAGTTCSPSPGTCVTLRDAINSANQDGSADEITFDPSVTGTITLTNGPLYVDNGNGIEIDGPGAGTLTVSGGNNSQIFTFSDAAAASPSAVDKIKGLTLTQGNASGSAGPGSGPSGGAIYDFNTTSNNTPYPLVPLVLNHDRITDSQADKYGGAIAVSAPLTLNHTTVTGNTAGRGGGITALPFEDETQKYGNLVTVENSVISHNHATYYTTPYSGGIASAAGGGGILAAGDALVVRNSTVTENHAKVTGGGIAVASKYGTTIKHSTITGNTAKGGGGLELYGWAFNSGPYHVRQDKYSPTSIEETTISGNHAQAGAGIHAFDLPAGNPTTIRASTISGNQGGHNSFGGGIDISGNLTAPFQVVDSTIAGNIASHGGGVSLGDPFNLPLTRANPATGKKGSVSLENSTIAGNVATQHGGGIYLGDYTPSGASSPRSGNAEVISTIVSGNYAAKKPNDLARASSSTAGGFKAAFSLVKTPGSAPLTHQGPVIVGKSPQLGHLANNGGPTKTMLPSGKSPVIDHGHNSLGLAVDQRGRRRTVDTSRPNPRGGDGTDIGAVELTASQVSAGAADFNATVGGKKLGGSATPLLVSGQTPVSCQVSVGQLSSCLVEVRLDGYVVAAGGRPASHPASRLTTTVRSSSVAQRYLKKHFPHGVNAKVYVVSTGGQLLAVVGQVHLTAGR